MIEVLVRGNYACFTRPEFKVERVSYAAMTPSAARGVLEAIFWKPEFRFEIQRIGIVSRGTQTAILRNEISGRQGREPIMVERQRQQRSSLVLKDVEYIIQADVVLREHATDPVYKYIDQFRRRVDRGQCHHTPYLGTREFAADFEAVGSATPDTTMTVDLGTMLFDLAYVQDKKRNDLDFVRHSSDGVTPVSGYVQALFFPARVEEGWLRIPSEKYAEQQRLEARRV